MKKSSLIVILVLAITSFIGCKPSVPDGIIGSSDMEDILYDYHVSRAMSRYYSTDQHDQGYNETLFMQAMLKKHGITQAEFDSSLVYYYSHADKFAKIYQNVTKRLNEEATEIGASVGALNSITTYSLNGDTANVWNHATELILMPNPAFNHAMFEIKADTSYRTGDSFQLSMQASYLYKSGIKDALIYVAVHYDNDSVSTHTSHCTVSGITTLHIPANDKQTVKDIRTFIYLSPSNDNSPNNMLFLGHIQLFRFHQSKDSKANQDNQEEVKEEEANEVPRIINLKSDSLKNAPLQTVPLRTAPAKRAPDQTAPLQTVPLKRRKDNNHHANRHERKRNDVPSRPHNKKGSRP